MWSIAGKTHGSHGSRMRNVSLKAAVTRAGIMRARCNAQIAAMCLILQSSMPAC